MRCQHVRCWPVPGVPRGWRTPVRDTRKSKVVSPPDKIKLQAQRRWPEQRAHREFEMEVGGQRRNLFCIGPFSSSPSRPGRTPALTEGQQAPLHNLRLD